MQSWHLLLLTAFAVYGLVSSTYTSGKCEVSWSNWSSWSHCNRWCGLGIQQRHRSCVSKGNCVYNYKQSRSPSRQNSNNDEHPTLRPSDANVVSSGEDPSEDTKRTADSIDLDNSNNNSFYESLKLLCPGVGHEVKKCFKTSCSYFSWTSWGSWSSCTRSCGGYGRRYRTRKCEKTYKYSPPICVGASREQESCGTTCCPVDATWGSWSPFSLCSRSCGGGYRISTRICIKAKCGGKNYCEGKYKRYIPCNQKCCPKPAYWGDWQGWSQCSKKCGGGISYRRRRCYQSKCPDPYHRRCIGKGYEHKKCNEHCCPQKPYWGRWADWTVCSKKCGGGISYRKRKCIPSKCPYSDPKYNKCDGSGYEEKKCNEHCCPEKPYWGRWDDWSICSKKCGGGISYRKRKCIPSKCPYSDPRYNKCYGSGYEEKKCNIHCCPERPQWSEWADWSSCNKKCGGGYSYRRRKCIPSKCPHPYYKTCEGSAYEEKRCNEKCCPVSPSWSKWEGWSLCSKKCGGGISYRKRKCIPSKCPYSDPRYNKCYGSGYEEKKCNVHCCPEKPYWGRWNDWTVCSKKCGGGISYRKRKCIPSKCPYSDPRYNKCDGSDYEEKKCNEHCCPERPYWSTWEGWSVCSKKCGGGISYRKRKCIPSKCPHPYYKTCQGSAYEEKKCNEQCCPEKPYWGRWNDWTVCNKKCGGGISYRKRKCYQSKCPHPYFKKCDGNDYEEKKCNEHCCPEKPYWGEWKDWSVCSKKCGGGISYRKRKCIPSKCPYSDPKYNKCDGSDYEEKKCNEKCCPEPDHFGEWSTWSKCSSSCGKGKKFRKRLCYKSKCPTDYRGCKGNTHEYADCDAGCCPKAGYWSSWSSWSGCSVSCGYGQQRRQRTCHKPECGGKGCYGSKYSAKACYIACNKKHNFYYTSWSSWSSCSKSCGKGGTRTRISYCIDYTKYYKDTPACPQKKQIDTESCFVKDCLKDATTNKPTKGGYYDHYH